MPRKWGRFGRRDLCLYSLLHRCIQFCTRDFVIAVTAKYDLSHRLEEVRKAIVACEGGTMSVSIQRASTPNALTHSLNDYMSALYNKISQRAFSLFEHNGRNHGHDVEDWLKAESEFLTPVALEVSETDSELAVRAEVPGFEEKDVEVVAEPSRLFISGKTEHKTEEKKKRTLYSEISSNEIFRSIWLPAKIDPDKVSATLKNGILEVSMQKAALAKKVAVSAKAA
jgi:HSP20 family protein